MKTIISHFVQTFDIDNINWSAQMVILKKLLKTYSKQQINYAIDYYKAKGINMYSLGYLIRGMDEAITSYKAEIDISLQVGDKSERNQRKFRKNNEAFNREKYYIDLFEKSDEDN